ncbi:MAG: hypothetical protein IKW03_09335 [Clostridia bacterium]|nr:hypothetical protein [Clostridia bacterium]
MEILVYILPFAVFSPVLIIGILKFKNLFSYKKANLEYIEAERKKTEYDSMWQHARAGISYTTYGYKKIGTYVFSVDDVEYEFAYSSDRDHGYLPDKITACYPKGKPQKAFAEGNAPFVKGFFTALVWCIAYFIVSLSVFSGLMYFFS